MTDLTRRRALQPDPLTPEQRRFNMSRIRGRDTGPELILRKALHARGCRYRVNVKGLPGTPDLVFSTRHAVIFVHGCYWHGHDCPKGVMPGTNTVFWEEKISRTRLRDTAAETALRNIGWRVLTVWECALRGRAKLNLSALTDEILEWLAESKTRHEIAGDWAASNRPPP